MSDLANETNGSSADLRVVPAVNEVLQHSIVGSLVAEQGREVVVGWVRESLAQLRKALRSEAATALPNGRLALTEHVADQIVERAEAIERNKIGPVVNASGVILHTGLGRAPLSESAKSALARIAGCSNMEVDLDTGERRYRGYQLLPAFQTLTGAEDALIVNNNAAATLLTLQGLGAGREIVISRSQLIEIGGSFRLPDIFQLSGAVLKEVGTTNRTRLSDYEQVIGPETAALLHVHQSNFRIVGFTRAPGIADLVPLARSQGVLAIDDIGSGAAVDVSRYGLPAEPTFADSLRHGADLVLGSGDKLLGGPQCGIILGRHDLVQRLRSHPLARAMRVDKLTLAALSATVDSYVRGHAEREIPTVSMLAASVGQLLERALEIVEETRDLKPLHVEARKSKSAVGGGSLPGAELPTAVLSVAHEGLTAEELARRLRIGRIRVFGRIHQEKVLLDLRSVLPQDDSKLALALRLASAQNQRSTQEPV